MENEQKKSKYVTLTGMWGKEDERGFSATTRISPEYMCKLIAKLEPFKETGAFLNFWQNNRAESPKDPTHQLVLKALDPNWKKGDQEDIPF